MPDLQAIYKEAQNLVAEGDYARAADKYGEIISEKPDLAEAHLNQGACFFQSGDLNRALEKFQEAINIDGNLHSAHYNKGKILLQMQNPADAVAAFEDALKLKSETHVWEELSHAANQANQFEKALDTAAKGIAEADKFSMNLHNERIFAFFKLDRAEDALEDVESIVQVRPWAELKPEQISLYSSVMALHGHSLMKQGQHEEALKYLQIANSSDPNPNRYHAQGVCLLQLERDAEAIPCLQKSIEGTDGTPDWRVLVAVATAFTRTKNHQKGAEYFEQALQQPEPKRDVNINFSYAINLMNLGGPHKTSAKQPLEFVHENDKTNWIASALLGTIYLDEEKYRETVDVLTHAIDASNGEADDTVYYNRAYALLMLELIEEAYADFQKALELNPNNNEAKTGIEQLTPEIEKMEEERRIAKEESEKLAAAAAAAQAAHEKAEREKASAAEAAKAKAAAEKAEAEAAAAKEREQGLVDQYFSPQGANFKIQKGGEVRRPGRRIQELQVLLKPNNSDTYYRRKSLEVIPKGIAFKGATSYADWFNKSNEQEGDKVFGQK